MQFSYANSHTSYANIYKPPQKNSSYQNETDKKGGLKKMQHKLKAHIIFP